MAAEAARRLARGSSSPPFCSSGPRLGSPGIAGPRRRARSGSPVAAIGLDVARRRGMRSGRSGRTRRRSGRRHAGRGSRATHRAARPGPRHARRMVPEDRERPPDGGLDARGDARFERALVARHARPTSASRPVTEPGALVAAPGRRARVTASRLLDRASAKVPCHPARLVEVASHRPSWPVPAVAIRGHRPDRSDASTR